MLADVLAAVTAADRGRARRRDHRRGAGRADRAWSAPSGSRRRSRCCATRPTRATRRPRRSGSSARSRSAPRRWPCCPGDCPLLDPSELDAALARLEPGAGGGRPRPPRHRHQRAADVAHPTRSRPGSARAAASATSSAPARRDLEVDVEPMPSLALDLDTPEDLDELAAALADEPDAAPATRPRAIAGARPARSDSTSERRDPPIVGMPEIDEGADLGRADRRARGAPEPGGGRGRRRRLAEGRLQGRGPACARWPTSSPASEARELAQRARQGPARWSS